MNVDLPWMVDLFGYFCVLVEVFLYLSMQSLCPRDEKNKCVTAIPTGFKTGYLT